MDPKSLRPSSGHLDLAGHRVDYTLGGLSEEDAPASPYELFTQWFDEAVAAGGEPNAMVLSTVSADGLPSSRTVLLKGVRAGGRSRGPSTGSGTEGGSGADHPSTGSGSDGGAGTDHPSTGSGNQGGSGADGGAGNQGGSGAEGDGFVFYTNYGSRKAQELGVQPRCALLFPWYALQRQVRVEGVATKVSREQSEAYFASRPRPAQLGAWASPQSEEVTDRAALDALLADATERFEGTEVPCPPHWGGYRVRPESVEFWQGRHGRMHDRLVYRRTPDGWDRVRLAP